MTAPQHVALIYNPPTKTQNCINDFPVKNVIERPGKPGFTFSFGYYSILYTLFLNRSSFYHVFIMWVRCQ